MPPLINLTGQIFGRLTVIDRGVDLATGIKPKTRWNCLCSCGNKTLVTTDCLRKGNTKSCGCLGYETKVTNAIKHGMYKSRDYDGYNTMIQRCYNPNAKFFKHYGGRGITVCDSWLKAFENYFEDMGVKPEGKSIDRINNDGNYEPKNCKWSTQKEQLRNSRRNRLLTFNCETAPVSVWAERYNIPYTVFYYKAVIKNLQLKDIII